ncbi:ABC transporter ATP-binding protein [Glycomyces terrestris]|uniref:ABC transporter ATP-binding protein n=1 Tax=Glycomyces terrestris TaxID=2493553 RepID=A0A426V3I8_9ACTN|nr:ABC transporter ATP-binding protein [Glycomyces terrestris]RRS01401.1 ABC transporter ATP-binding protein [Glycomyces terrestris]
MIELEGVSWTYPHAAQPSLRNLDLHIRPGEFVVLCGASGSGKSTALRLMNGLIPHFHEDGTLSGTVRVAGLTTAEARLDELGAVTGTVLQHPRRQFFTDTAEAEVAFAMEQFGFPPGDIRARVDGALSALSAWVPLDQSLQRLSGGQQQQVAIAAATAHGPRVLLLDEPSANLSADAVDRLRAVLGELRARGTTVVVAEHRLRYLQHLADRIVVMREGAIDTEWTAAEFNALTDEALAREGLRGRVAVPVLKPAAAEGASVVDSALDGAPAQTDSSGLELVGVKCRLGGRTVLDLDYASFAAGAVTAVSGANGAGKSTLARIVAGLQRSTGQVRLGGKPLPRRARQRTAAIVMQDVQRQLFTDSVRAEIDAAGDGDGEAAMSDLDLAQLADRHPLSLSGGQQQRLVIATVRAAARRVVIFDEPSSGVDRRHLRSIADQIRRTAADGAVVLLISHDDDLLDLAADRRLTLRRPDRGPTNSDPTNSAPTNRDRTP